MRLIDADALQISTEFSDDGEYSWDIVPAFRIREAPTIDAVSVVRCRDCIIKYRLGDEDLVCGRTGVNVDDDDFCSFGAKDE